MVAIRLRLLRVLVFLSLLQAWSLVQWCLHRLFGGANKIEMVTKNNRDQSVDNSSGAFTPSKGVGTVVATSDMRTVFLGLISLAS